MSFKPAMSICCVKKVQLAPGKRAFGIDGSVQGLGLHTSDEPGMEVRSSWAIAGITSEGTGGCQNSEEGRL